MNYTIIGDFIMIIKPFGQLPKEFQNDKVKPYYDILYKKRASLVSKRLLDIGVSVVLTLLLILPILIIAVVIKLSSKGPVFYKQERVTKYGKKFYILKFRTMYEGADKEGPLVTCGDDSRITGVGRVLRKFRLDELPQIFHVLSGTMSIVGTRPEVTKYVDCYTQEMMATLLMPAGITSLASIKFKDESELLRTSQDPDKDYVEKILPQKMEYNLEYISKFGFRRDIYLMFKTLKEVIM